MNKSIAFYKDDNNYAYITMDLENEAMNKLSSSMLIELDEILESIKDDKTIKVLIFKSLKEKTFIAGADISEIKNINNREEAFKLVSQGQNIITKISHLPFPSISVINGHCLGGGLELALACDFRIATEGENSKLGLPEVSLGIIPGFGGTQRLPRLVGLTNSLNLILTGRPINYRKAYKIGLIDDYFHEEFLDKYLNSFIDRVLNYPDKITKRRKNSRGFIIRLMEFCSIGRAIIFRKAFKSLMAKTKGKYPAPLAALRVIKKTYKKNIKKGLEREIQAFVPLIETDVFKNLVDLFFTNQKLKKADYQLDESIAKKVNKTAVLGAGVMGGGISWAFAMNGFFVVMKDINWLAVSKGLEWADKIFRKLLKLRKIKRNEAVNRMHKIDGRIDYSGFKNSDLVVEAVVENLHIKKNVFEELEKHVSRDTIIASNTSSLTLEEMSSGLKFRSRFVGMHFFNPVDRMPLVEIVYNKETDPVSVATTFSFARDIGKVPILVKDCNGFLVNRILMAYLNEAGHLLSEGYTYKFIDEVMEDFGMPMGPFRLMDEIGMDIGAKIGNIFNQSYGKRFEISKPFSLLYKQNIFLGRKNNNGFYKYSGNKKKINRKMVDFLRDSIVQKNNKKDRNEILQRCLYQMVNESTLCLENDIVKSAEILDMALILGIGFPPFVGGILKYADRVGLKPIVGFLNDFNKTNDDRIYISSKLSAMSQSGERFYPL